MDDGESWYVFPDARSWNECREFFDREQIAHDQGAIAAYESERSAYHARVQALRTERESLR
jgi:hypothetical protein